MSQRNHIYLAMKEYAEWYAKQCLSIAAENVKFQYGDIDVEGLAHKEIVDLDYEKNLLFQITRA